MRCPKCDEPMGCHPADPSKGEFEDVYVCINDECGHIVWESDLDDLES